MLARDLSTWEQMKDASGRVYLADRVTGSSKWLWTKWDLNGQVFCENVLTKERRWPNDMDITLKVAAGMANASELKLFRSGASGYDQAAASQGRIQGQIQSNTYNRGSVGAKHTQYGHHRQQQHGYASNGEHQRRSYASVTTGNGSYGGYSSGQQHSMEQPNGSFGQTQYGVEVGSGYGSSTRTASLSNTHSHEPTRTQTHPHSSSPNTGIGEESGTRNGWGWGDNSGRGWGNNTEAMHKQMNSTPGHAVGRGTSTTSYGRHTKEAQYPQASHIRRNTPDGTITGTRTVHVTTKRAAQNDGGRYWQPLKTQPMKRSGRNATLMRTNKFVFRAKPLPINDIGNITSSFRSKFAPSTSGARKLLKIATSLTNAHIVAAMHERDFAISKHGPKVSNATTAGDDLELFNISAVIGTCIDLEKDYLRLTSAPKPEFVRPPNVLKLALEHVMNRWKRREQDYDWVCRQLKAIRQDYKVQHVESPDSLQTYETHARLALENGDLGEFNTCVAQAQDLHGKIDCCEKRKDEFAAYRILYNTVVAGSSYEQARLLSDFTPKERSRSATSFALAMRAAFRTNNYIRFFDLFANPPPDTHLPYLAQRLVPAARSKALAAMIISYAPARPSLIPLTSILTLLGLTGPPRDVEINVSPPKHNPTDDEVRSLNQLNILNESTLFKDAVLFLLSINSVILRDEEGDLVIDCKATKLKGVVVIDHQTGLITHAGGQ